MAAEAPLLDVGAQLAPLALPDTHGSTVEITGAARPLLVVFLPVAFSPVCGREVAELNAAVGGGSLPADVVGISCDSMFALRAWAAAEELAFPLLSDFWPHGQVAQAFGAFDETTGLALRASFLLVGAHVRWRVVSPGGRPRSIAGYREAVAAL
ncbi:MAG TPA: redoxin domain-containing protein [Actinomycetaceae bacterium]|nr:redoxin domain-containing protein [Actinomycetaceae bacterium]